MSQIDWNSRFPFMTPVKSPPALFRINGCGVGLYGKRDHDPETGTYVATWCLSLLFMPCLCLRAYRVAPAPAGWYFIGRESLSSLAKTWNFVVLGLMAATIATIGIAGYTSTPAYNARQQMAQAQRQTAAGHPGQAAAIYQRLILTSSTEAGNARQALGALLVNPDPQVQLREFAGVFASAVQVTHHGASWSQEDLVKQALALVAARGAGDPHAGADLLETVRSLAIDTRPVDQARLPLLRQWAAAEPKNLDALVPLALLLEQQNQLDEAKALLLPAKDRLAGTEGARVLGTILGSQGDYEGSYALLWPYTRDRLGRLHAAEKAAEDALKRAWEQEIALLDKGDGPADFYHRYKISNKEEQDALVQQYVGARIKNNPQMTSTQQALERETSIVPVALELGMVMLQRAQGQADPKARRQQLESAEQVFLSIRSIAGQTDEYRLYLGQVSYWLGKQAEGHKLFEDLLTANKRAVPVVLGIAAKLREVGADAEARALGEEAYSKASEPAEKYQAALFRSLCFKDNDDEIFWLSKSDTANPMVKATLASARGHKALEEGRDSEAANLYQQAVDAYAIMPRSATTLNQTALAYMGFFYASGDRKALDHSVDCFQQAVSLEPSDSILLYNAGVTLTQAALADVIGKAIDLRALHLTGSLDWVGYLYRDEASRAAMVQRIKDHPGMVRALSYLEKFLVLAPKKHEGYQLVVSIRQFLRDDEALAGLEQRIKAADLDPSDVLARTRDHLAGTNDARDRTSLTAALKRWEDLSTQVRPQGGASAAIALTLQVGILSSLDTFNGNADPDKVVVMAEEAVRLAPSAAADSYRMHAYLFRLIKDLRKRDPAVAAWYQKFERALDSRHLIAAAIQSDDALAKAVRAHPDFQRAVALWREELTHFPDTPSVTLWAVLRKIDPPAAESVAQAIRKNPRALVAQSIDNMLDPASTSQALDTYWLMQIHGRPDEATQALRRVTSLGVPLPIEP